MRTSDNIVPLCQAQFSEKSPPRKPKNGDVRPREYLIDHEVDALIKQARQGRHGHRDATLILITYRHGLRVSEAITLKWSDVEFKSGVISIRRAKRGQDGVHPLSGTELRALRRLQWESRSPNIFVSERGSPMTPRNVRQIVARAGRGLAFPVHPHMLRHGCG
jgi:type 1 fimbriae regulatory protein FimE